jgi:multidrug resistance efflux pump
MDVCSPKNGFVIRMIAKDGIAVNVGDDLLVMDSDREQRALEDLQARKALMLLDLNKYTGEELKLTSQIAQSAVDFSTAQLNLAKPDEGPLRPVLPAHTPVDPIAAQAREQADVLRELQARFDNNRAISDQKQLEFFIARQLKSNEIAVKMNEYYTNAIQDMIKRLTIKAPISGQVKLHVGQGSFARLGSVLLEIR